MTVTLLSLHLTIHYVYLKRDVSNMFRGSLREVRAYLPTAQNVLIDPDTAIDFWPAG